MTPWLTRLGTVNVEKLPGVDFGPLGPAASARPKGIQHTTEGGFEGSLAVLRRASSPHFLIGRDKTGKLRAVQLVALGRKAGAVEHPSGTPETNGLALAQVELVGFAQLHPWLPDPGVTDLLAHLYATLNDVARIPLQHVANGNRSRAVYESGTGWFGHGDVPDQPQGHWDPGQLDYVTLFTAAAALRTRPRWLDLAAKMSPLWAWMIWRDHGAPPALRPSQIPARVPASWWPRYLIHRLGV